jgi:hypothetical protein
MSCVDIIKWIAPIGLILDIIGAYLIFKYGLPEELSRTGATFIITEEEDPDEIVKAKKYDKLSKLGFRLLIVGFLLQLISSIINVI